MKKSYSKKLCLCAILAAICFVLDYCTTLLNTATGIFKLPLSGLPIIIAAIFCGPLWGGAVGLVGTFITQMITYGFTPTTVLWILPAALRGISAGLLFIAFRRSMRISILTVEIIITSLIVTAANTLVMYVDSVIYHYYSFAYVFGGLIVRLCVGIAASVVFALVLPPIMKLLNRQLK